jgi:hypothetical protein
LFQGALAIPGLNNCPESSDLPLPVPEVYRTPGSVFLFIISILKKSSSFRFS